ncbi:MAG: hypothetical protein IPK26_05520 [Planctomycetes bacterium]|nr:hypothetical protein [Planctomycetota bacterium]
MPKKNPAGYAWLCPAVVAFFWFLPALRVGYLSDDFLLVYYVDREHGSVLWGRVLEEFVRPWFGVRDLYRPMVSLSVGVNAALSGLGAVSLHVGNVLFVAVAAAAAAATAGRLVPQRPGLAAVVAGLVVVAHPAMVEPATWIAARTSALEVMFALLAWAAFVAHLDGQARPWRCWLLVVAALASKEGAVMLPASLLALDLLHGCERTLRQRVATHLPIALLVLGYLLWRKLLLGYWTTAETHHGLASRAGSIVQQMPALVGWPAVGWPLTAVAVVIALALPLLSGRRRWLPLLLLVWVAAMLLPTSHVASASASTGRLVCSAAPVVALILARAVGVPSAGRWRWLSIGAPFLAIVGLAWAGRTQLHAYVRGGQAVQAMQAELGRVTARSPVTAPMALASMPIELAVPVLQAKLFGLLGLRPFHDRDLAVVGMPGFLQADNAAPQLLGDGAPLFAVLAAGGSVANWSVADGAFDSLPPLLERPVRVDVGDTGRVVTTASGRVFGALAVTAAAGQVVRLRLEGDLPLPGVGPFGELQRTASGGGEVVFDLTHRGALLVRAQAGLPPPVFLVTIDGAPAPTATAVELRPGPGALAVTTTRAGAPCAFAELAASIPRPDATVPLRLYVLLPTSTAFVDVAPGEPIVWTDEAKAQLGFAQGLLGTLVVRWFWQTLPGHDGSPSRSAIDWSEVR